MNTKLRRQAIRIIHRANRLWCDLATVREQEICAGGDQAAIAALSAACDRLLDVTEQLHVAIRKEGNYEAD